MMDKFKTMKKIVNLSVLVDILMIMLFSFIMTTNGEMEKDREKNAATMKALQNQNATLEKLLEKDCHYVVIKLAGGLGELRSFEIEDQEETESITFSNDNREQAQKQLLTYLEDKKPREDKLFLIFNYDGKNAWARDVSIVQSVVQTIKEDIPVYYLENNVTDFQ